MSYSGRSLARGCLNFCWDAVGVFYSPSRLGNRTRVRRFLALCRDVVDVFYSPSWLGWNDLNYIWRKCLINRVNIKWQYFNPFNCMLLELLVLKSIKNHFTVCKQMGSGSFKNNVTDKLFVYNIYMYIPSYWPNE